MNDVEEFQKRLLQVLSNLEKENPYISNMLIKRNVPVLVKSIHQLRISTLLMSSPVKELKKFLYVQKQSLQATQSLLNSLLIQDSNESGMSPPKIVVQFSDRNEKNNKTKDTIQTKLKDIIEDLCKEACESIFPEEHLRVYISVQKLQIDKTVNILQTLHQKSFQNRLCMPQYKLCKVVGVVLIVLFICLKIYSYAYFENLY
jgi:hypothetical protein